MRDSEEFKAWEEVRDYLRLLLDDSKNYGILIEDEEWNLLYNELDRCGNEYIDSLQKEKI